MQNWQFSRTNFAHFGATPASDRFDRERAARGIDFDAVGKARMIENRAKIDPHSLRERHPPFFMKRRKVIKYYYYYYYYYFRSLLLLFQLVLFLASLSRPSAEPAGRPSELSLLPGGPYRY